VVFSAPIFLFGFLPLALLMYFLSPKKLKNIVLLIISLVFYAWGEVFYLAIMLTSILANYSVGLCLHWAQDRVVSHDATDDNNLPKIFLILGVVINLVLLISFKYANFITDNVNFVLEYFQIDSIELAPVHLPLGISFFTFQAISYIVDVYRRQASVQRNILNFALYISLFPQLIAGPIVRYKDIAEQILERKTSTALFANGSRRFVYGLAKKVLIANSLGEVADITFAMSGNDLTAPIAWVGIIAYSLQIYFDFSGYSDMAIGLGMMFGFKFLENFNYPYISKSIQEFWRRWHISLSTWFRDYVYISLGGNRVPKARTYLNLLIVFILTGFWHGASWNFLIWGLFHGAFLAAEHAGFSKVLKRSWVPVQHFYVLMIAIIGWVFFRSETLSQAFQYIGTMFDLGRLQTSAFQFAQILSTETILAFIGGLILMTPVYNYLRDVTAKKLTSGNVWVAVMAQAYLAGLLFLCMLKIASSTYDPFIYFRF